MQKYKQVSLYVRAVVIDEINIMVPVDVSMEEVGNNAIMGCELNEHIRHTITENLLEIDHVAEVDPHDFSKPCRDNHYPTIAPCYPNDEFAHYFDKYGDEVDAYWLVDQTAQKEEDDVFDQFLCTVEVAA